MPATPTCCASASTAAPGSEAAGLTIGSSTYRSTRRATRLASPPGSAPMDTATRKGRGANADEPRCGANPARIGYVGDG